MVAREERTSPAMIVDVQGRGIAAIAVDDNTDPFAAIDVLQARQRGVGEPTKLASLRASVEVQRRFGGLAPRALIGGEFVAGGAETVFRVNVSASSSSDEFDITCASRLWKRGFISGLPAEFAGAVLRGLMSEGLPELPPGILAVDHAGFDEVESATPIFVQTGSLFRQVVAAVLYDDDVEDRVRDLMDTW